MTRRLLNVVILLSLLLCLAVCVLWVRSHEHPGRAKWRIGAHDYGIRSARGVVEVRRGWDPWDLMDSADPYRPLDSVPRWLGVERAGWWEQGGGWIESRGVRFPHALPALLASVPPLVWVVWRLAGGARRRAAARRPELCPHCGYDLTGNVSGVCPECGTTNKERGAA